MGREIGKEESSFPKAKGSLSAEQRIFERDSKENPYTIEQDQDSLY